MSGSRHITFKLAPEWIPWLRRLAEEASTEDRDVNLNEAARLAAIYCIRAAFPVLGHLANQRPGVPGESHKPEEGNVEGDPTPTGLPTDNSPALPDTPAVDSDGLEDGD